MSPQIKSKILALGIINGLTAALVAVVVIQPGFLGKNNANAATAGYTSAWKQTKCVSVVLNSMSFGIGPAEWEVTHTLSNGQRVIEKWTPSAWDTSAGAGMTPTVEDATSGKCNPLSAGIGTRSIGNYYVQGGQYAVIRFQNGAGEGASRMIPLGWNVSSTVQ
jgi:hypothetical protein